MYKYDDLIKEMAVIPINEIGGFTAHYWQTNFTPAYQP